MNADTYDAKKNLLDSAFGAGQVNLHKALTWLSEEDYTNDTRLEDYSEDEIKSLISHTDRQDADEGPYKSWYAAHIGMSRSSWVMLSNNAWLRERAYVLWDWNRVCENSLLKIFEGIPEHISSLLVEQKDYEEMLASFDARSKSWQKGGRGYWTKDSRVN